MPEIIIRVTYKQDKPLKHLQALAMRLKRAVHEEVADVVNVPTVSVAVSNA